MTRHPVSYVLTALYADLFRWRYGRTAAQPATCTECRDGETPDGGYCACPKGRQREASDLGADFEPEADHIIGARQ